MEKLLTFKQMLNENLTRKELHDILMDFVDFCADKLGIETLPDIEYKESTKEGEQPSFGGYSPHSEKLMVYSKNRHPMDIFRTVAHELVHHKQNEEGRIRDVSKEGSTGSKIENEANSIAGQLMRLYGKSNPQCFDLSYVTEEMLEEGINDRGSFKAIFLAGGAGAGKDFILHKTLDGLGLKELNSDKAFEFLMKKNNLSMTMPDHERFERDLVRGKAKTVTHVQKELHLQNRIGVIINGTADEFEKIAKLKKGYEELGYDTMMVFVGTSNKVSRQRNILRGQLGGRTVPEDIRFSKWRGSNKNKDRFKELFGDRNFIYVDNGGDISKMTPEQKQQMENGFTQVFKRAKSFVDSKVSNPHAQDWIAKERIRRNLMESYVDIQFESMINEVGGAGNWGTDQLRKRYMMDTPGQEEPILGLDKRRADWMENPKILYRFMKKYGDYAPKRIKDVKESLEGTMYDSGMGVSDSSSKDDVKPDQNTDYEKTSIIKKHKYRSNRKQQPKQ